MGGEILAVTGSQSPGLLSSARRSVLDRATAPQSSALRNPDTRWGSHGDLRPLMGAEIVTPEEPHPFDSYPWPQQPSSDDVQRITHAVKEILILRATHSQMGLTLARQYDVLRIPGKSQLRDLHQELDTAVLQAYGFSRRRGCLGSASSAQPGRRSRRCHGATT